MATDETYFEWHGDHGPVVVLIHGLGLNHAMWQWQVPALARRYRILTYDLYGHGRSVGPPAEPDLALFSAQLRQLLDQSDVGQCSVLGFSLGGMICRRFAMDHPERLLALGILFSPHKRTQEAQAAIEARVEQARLHGPASTVDAALVRWFTEPFRHRNPETTELVRQWVMANDRTVYHRIYRVLADGFDELVAPRPAIACPALVMTGDEDYGNPPEAARAIARDIPAAETVVLPGLRHLAMIEDPDQVNRALLSFLDRVHGEVATA